MVCVKLVVQILDFDLLNTVKQSKLLVKKILIGCHPAQFDRNKKNRKNILTMFDSQTWSKKDMLTMYDHETWSN